MWSGNFALKVNNLNMTRGDKRATRISIIATIQEQNVRVTNDGGVMALVGKVDRVPQVGAAEMTQAR